MGKIVTLCPFDNLRLRPIVTQIHIRYCTIVLVLCETPSTVGVDRDDRNDIRLDLRDITSTSNGITFSRVPLGGDHTGVTVTRPVASAPPKGTMSPQPPDAPTEGPRNNQLHRSRPAMLFCGGCTLTYLYYITGNEGGDIDHAPHSPGMGSQHNPGGDLGSVRGSPH